MSMAIGQQHPWKIDSVEFKQEDANRMTLHLHIGFERGAKFTDSEGLDCPVYDTVAREWRHLNFFEHECLLHCHVPRITTNQGKVRTVDVPWSRKGSGFTLLFEAYAMALIENEMPVNKVAKLLRVNPQRLWNVFNYWVGEAYLADDPSSITQLGVDETSTRKGHKYITLGVDMEQSRVVHVTEGKGKETLGNIQKHLKLKKVNPRQIKQLSMDLSPAFIAGAKESFPKASITFDRFHVVKLLNEAMDAVRRSERKEHEALKGHKYTFLKNTDKLSDTRKQKLAEFITLYPTLGEAYRMKETFNVLWEMDSEEKASEYIDVWCDYAMNHSGIPAFIKFAKTVKSHKSGIVNFVKTRISNGILEGINSKVQLAKRRARGYRNVNNLINMIYFLCGKLKFNYPLRFT